ncbi:hypothetical protein C8R46DRAFT_1074850 [Mycena filopes]|nr:hypothetical protein C8R46DRAFT_1098310 [Mycena filopes]KAJ7177676.1 hypothetical protein C8R46DRAFT_1074850 [Mycena filopes]
MVFFMLAIGHHCQVTEVVAERGKISAIADLVWTLIEFAGALTIKILTARSTNPWVQFILLSLLSDNGDSENKGAGNPLTTTSSILMLTTLILTIIFRIATMAKFPKPFSCQDFTFLGGCTPHHPPYTAMRIFFGRSIARPLVRKESRPILVVRGVIIWCIAFGVPIFALYTIIFNPRMTRISSQAVSPFTPGQTSFIGSYSPSGAATLLMRHVNPSDADPDPTAYNIQTRMASHHRVFQNKTLIDMEQLGTTDKWTIIPDHSVTWQDILNVSISLSLPAGETGVYIVPVTGCLDVCDSESAQSWLISYGDLLDGVLLVRGSNLVGTFSWTRRDTFRRIGWMIGSPPRLEVYTPKINNLQSFAEGGTSDPNTATLTLIQMSPYATEYFRDTVDSSVLDGIATFGGFWTFLNGTFALFFGANVLYFAFGRRPLSALGIVHFLQRKQLRRQWNEDFPSIHTEGGLPGSESAGIVAFIRERLVDLEDLPPNPPPKDPPNPPPEGGLPGSESARILMDLVDLPPNPPPKDPQNPPSPRQVDRPDDIYTQSSQDPEEIRRQSIQSITLGYSAMRESGYILEEIPLLDADLESGGIPHTNDSVV